MDERTINQPCVRVITNIDDKHKSQGSGTLVKGVDGYYVITAYHCLYGEQNQLKYVKEEHILIETQEFYNSPFECIKVLKIVASSEAEDWALLRVADVESEYNFPEILASDSFKTDMPVTFTGFQSLEPNQCRTFKSRVLNGISSNEFRITLSNQDRFESADDARGLSGSGAFIINDNKLYLIGILKSVKGEDATNNDIKCCPLSSFIDVIGLEKYDISTEIFGDNWGSDQFGELVPTDSRDLIEKIKAVNSTISELKIKRYCKELALGKSELSNILERDLSAIKYRIFDACQGELIDFLERGKTESLTVDQINELLQQFKNKAIEIIQVKSKKYIYPILDDELIFRIVLDLINECYLSFDEEGVYAE